jgi:hypothetical protein
MPHTPGSNQQRKEEHRKRKKKRGQCDQRTYHVVHHEALSGHQAVCMEAVVTGKHESQNASENTVSVPDLYHAVHA